MMKRTKRNFISLSPSSSTPAQSGMHPFTNRDSDVDTSNENLGYHASPRQNRHRNRFGLSYPLEVETQTSLGRSNTSNSSLLNLSNDQSPDGNLSISTLNKSLNGSGVGDHIQHSITYARTMEHKAMSLSNRLNNVANLSMSPRQLFASESNNQAPEEFSNSSRKRRSTIDDLNLQTYMALSQQTTTTVERYVRYAECCPEKVNSRTPNRFMNKFVPGESSPTNKRLRFYNPLFNSVHLMGTFSNLDELSRTPLAVLYKARHRISGLLYCVKRSRSDFENDKHFGSSMSEIFNEVQALSLLQHNCIISYYSSWFEAEAIHVQLEFCLGGSLFHLMYPDRIHDTSDGLPLTAMPSFELHSSMEDSMNSDQAQESSVMFTPFNERERKLGERPLVALSAHVISALNYMHTNWSIVHGDIKPSNILIQLNRPTAYLAALKEDIEGEAKNHTHKLLLNGETDGIVFKLADFGRSSRAGEDRDGENLGDGRYLPALNDPSPPARAATGRDLYALGLTVYDAAGGPMSGEPWNRFRESGSLPDLTMIPPSLLPFVNSVLRPLAQDRPTAAELIKYPVLHPHLLDSSFNPSMNIPVDVLPR